MTTNSMEIMTVGGGCFWCIEAVLQEVKGVEKVVSGYTGGTVPGKPTYREVCSGLTGHAEVVQVSFDPTIISYEDLIGHFHDQPRPNILKPSGWRCWHPIPFGYLLSQRDPKGNCGKGGPRNVRIL